MYVWFCYGSTANLFSEIGSKMSGKENKKSKAKNKNKDVR
jgi:hypothetical protein